MPNRSSPNRDAAQRGTWLLLEVGRELRIARVRGGWTQRQVGRAARCSASHISRVERGKAPRVSARELVVIAAVVGLRLWIRAYPDGRRPVDAAQLGLIRALNARIHPGWRRQIEAVIPLPGDLRAVDELIETDGCRIAVEAITRFADVQAQVRHARTKQRDLPADRLILLVKGSHANRRMLHEADPVLRDSFSVAPRAAFRALADGHDPGGDCVLLL
jgi:transcriptional regulator with XRE-family HTH domain